ncbi:hypothetical protein I6J77_17305 [Rhodanobacter sp. FDAARGOS 1247]|uniref:hypothetical protein n=1 Tax=Rhodanobacter sp. FDAARGOS 1247 TaxID=2778082 RepID=UPI0019513D61|nr:hypothetical protein [Rhodanobacter sp. FDAARGOS 1247]QRP63825.1 hypothetical protein I6J77_17305 [Rhodanobacter sp. FDAARGOS 1247]
MKALLLAALLSVISVPAPAQEHREFLSWYNGWTVQTIWGVGKIYGSYFGTTVKCGSVAIPVHPIYDTHQAAAPPTAKESSEYAAAKNLALLHELEANGNKCTFQLIAEKS